MKFGGADPELMEDLRQHGEHELLRKVLRRIATADSPAALHRYVTRIRRRKEKQAEPM